MVGGGHSRFDRLISDKEKYNEAILLGWYVLRFVRDDILGNPFDMVEMIRKVLHQRHFQAPLVDELTDKEEKILLMTAAGFRLQEISARTGIKTNAVRSIYQSINQKLCVRSRASAVARALSWGLIRFEMIPFQVEEDFTFDDEELD